MNGLFSRTSPPFQSEQQVAGVVEANTIGTIDAKLDDFRIRAGRDDEVVLQLLLIAVVDDVDAGIDIFVIDLSERSGCCCATFRDRCR